MSVNIYSEDASGNLKFIAEVDDEDNPELAVDALLDEMPKLKVLEFVTVVGTLDDGEVSRVEVESEEIVQPRRSMRHTRTNEDEDEAPAPKKRAPKKKAAAPVEEDEDEGDDDIVEVEVKKPAAKKPAPKKAAAKPAAKKPAAKKKGSPFKKSDDGE